MGPENNHHWPPGLIARAYNVADIQREESIAKRRNFQPTNAEDNLDSDEDLDIGTSQLSDSLSQMLQAVYSDSQEAQLEATTKFRKCVRGGTAGKYTDIQTAFQGEESAHRSRD